MIRKRISLWLALAAMAFFTFFAVTAHAEETVDSSTKEPAVNEKVERIPNIENTEPDRKQTDRVEPVFKEGFPYGWIPGSRWAGKHSPGYIPVHTRLVDQPLSNGRGTETLLVHDLFKGWAETADGEVYPIFDEPPVICARDLAVTDMELLHGFDLQQALLDRAEVSDREDPYPGGVTVSVYSFDRTAFYVGNGLRSVTAILKAEDSSGNVSYCTFEVTRTTGRLVGMNRFGWGDRRAADDYIRSVDADALLRAPSAGGLSAKSVWRREEAYADALTQALINLEKEEYLVTFTV